MTRIIFTILVMPILLLLGTSVLQRQILIE